MNNQQIDAIFLAEAFPEKMRPAAMLVGVTVANDLASRRWIDRFAVRVEDQEVLIPARLYFASHSREHDVGSLNCLMLKALRSRSDDGFERQRAARCLLADIQPWSAPFIITLIGEYVIEILEDIERAMEPAMEQMLAAFIIENPSFWETIKRRVASYWNVYYRHESGSDGRRAYSRAEYIGFKLVGRLELAARPRAAAGRR